MGKALELFFTCRLHASLLLVHANKDDWFIVDALILKRLSIWWFLFFIFIYHPICVESLFIDHLGCIPILKLSLQWQSGRLLLLKRFLEAAFFSEIFQCF